MRGMLGNLAATIAAATSLVVAVTTLCVQFGRLIGRLTVVIAELRQQTRKVDAMHEIVNGQRTELNERIDQLTQSLTDAGAEVPSRADLHHGQDPNTENGPPL